MKLTYIGEAVSYDVNVKAIQPNVVEVTGSNLVMKESGFTLADDAHNVYDYSAYSTLYKTVLGGFQYSNDGSVWVEPTKTVYVQSNWDDDDNARGVRPSSVKVNVFDNEQSVGSVTLNAKNSWTKTYENVPVSHNYTITAPDVLEYEKSINGSYVSYSIIRPYEPSLEEQVEELNAAVVDLDERVYELEGGN